MMFVAACSAGVSEKHFELAQDYARQSQYLRAIEEFTRVVNSGEQKPLALQAQLQIAKIYEENLKDYARAIRAYRDVYLRAQDKDIKLTARLAVAKIYSDRLENPSAAADEYALLFKEGGQYRKEGPDIVLAWAKNLSDAGRFAEASDRYELFRKLYTGHKDGPRTLLDEGQALLAERKEDEAIALFRNVIENFSNKSEYNSLVGEAYYGLGSALEAQSDLGPALEAYKQALTMYPNKKVIELKIDRVSRRKQERPKS
jgi:tetratricopeptide (TPR) repeat protein